VYSFFWIAIPSLLITSCYCSIAIEASTQIGYSKLRVAFDHEKVSKSTASLLNIHSSHLSSNSTTPSIYHRENTFNGTINGPNHSFSTSGTPTSQNLNNDITINTSSSMQGTSMQSVLQQPVIGDITEPFWVQSTNDGAVWGDPDDLCLSEAKRLISNNDKKIFWEMARSIMVSKHCKASD